jgi:hypothetical protein
VLERIKACLAKHGDTTSRFDKLKRSAARSMYVFRVDGERRCPYGADHSGSNNFAVLVRDRALLYHCSSGECSEVRPMRQIGKLTRFRSMLGGETARWPPMISASAARWTSDLWTTRPYRATWGAAI